MPDPFVISGVVRSRDGDPDGLVVVVSRRELPSRERQRPAGPVVLGRAPADREGRFRLEVDAPAGTDLGFGVLDRDGRALQVAVGGNRGEIVFNAASPLDVTLAVSRRDDPATGSEYETLLALAAPDLDGFAPADLADDDLDFLARDLGGTADEAELRQRLAFLRAAGVLAGSTRVVPAAFYGWARLGVPDLWTQLPSFEDADRRDDFLTRLLDELAGTEAERLADALRRAADARIVPARLAERADALARAVRRRALVPVSVRLQLVAGGRPLAGHRVAVTDGDRPLGTDVTDPLGAVVVAYDADPADPGATRELRLQVSGPLLADPVELTVATSPPGSTVEVPLPAPPDLGALVAAGHVRLAPGTLDALSAAGIAGYADIRRRGGIAAVAELAQLDPDDARRLDALTQLDLLTADPGEAAVLLERDYAGVGAVAAEPWGRFLARVAGEQGLPYERAVRLRAAAQAQVGVLDMLLAGCGSDLANGYAS